MEEERAAAARAAAKECVRIILDGQAKEGGLETLNWQNKDGDTALIWAAEAGQAEIAQYLMEKGAPPPPSPPSQLCAPEVSVDLNQRGSENLLHEMACAIRF
eukprot:COSAG04_NODE_2052_length_4910_cov_2.514446_3_plen_102_part_00